MKQFIFYLCIVGVISFSSCLKDAVKKPEVDIAINKSTFNVGDTAKFIISGLPYNLVFYSGEPGNDYYSKDIYTASGGVSSMIFTTALATAAGSSTATNLKILVSNNFSGNYNQTEIAAANWVDVSSQVTVPGTDTVELNPYKVEGKPIYVAFRFQTEDETKSQRQLTVSNFSVKTVFPNQSYTNANNVYFAGFASFDFAGDAANFWNIPVTSNTNNSFTHPLVAANSAKDDDWAISKGFNTNSVMPSTGIAIKALSSNLVTNYSYVFTKAGTYKVVFVASNNNQTDSKEVVKEFNVTVN
ncbi:DUF5017 domain-containing protein [Lacibacter sediminis]|uniref:DUF5017 domain-containing protein n=1 Tax=Lacibacter sediminis TaxID=2760713 RepID=A0A7G5XDA9_9BACT|nr:DUF5017 domain-containing protein [Lacibacter sediminis]QNA43462.1 DUF5017 domain-containing protein [Lacibacter sediminis]